MPNPDAPKADTLSDLIATLQAEAGLGKPRSPPPVHLWNPVGCGDIGLEIRRDGSWWQDGVRFSREALVRLFSSILRRDEDGYYLVTPHEKVVIRVEDAPFVGVRADRSMGEDGPAILVTTNVGDVVVVNDEHPLRVLHDPATGEPSTYVRIRGGLEARLARPPYYDLVSWSEPGAEGRDLVVRSCGRTYSLGPCE